MGEISQMNATQKDIVLVHFPFSDRNEQKVRPALIVSNDAFNKQSTEYIMIPITSVIKSMPYSVIIKQENLSSGKLIVESRIRFDKFFTLDKRIIRFKIGTLNNYTFVKVRKEILNLL
jgi:mRNA interferase MazF